MLAGFYLAALIQDAVTAAPPLPFSIVTDGATAVAIVGLFLKTRKSGGSFTAEDRAHLRTQLDALNKNLDRLIDRLERWTDNAKWNA